MGLLESLTNIVKSTTTNNTINTVTGTDVKAQATNALIRPWAFTDDFKVIINIPNKDTTDSKNIIDSLKKFELLNVNGNLINTEGNISDFVISVNLPTFSSSEIDNVFGSVRYVATKINEAYRFSIRFRDTEDYKIYQFFKLMFYLQKNVYPDDVGIDIKIMSLPKDRTFFKSSKCLVLQVSPPELSTTDSKLIEFDVNFISSEYIDMAFRDGVVVDKLYE
jgi:hypothetical protein